MTSHMPHNVVKGMINLTASGAGFRLFLPKALAMTTSARHDRADANVFVMHSETISGASSAAQTAMAGETPVRSTTFGRLSLLAASATLSASAATGDAPVLEAHA